MPALETSWDTSRRGLSLAVQSLLGELLRLWDKLSLLLLGEATVLGLFARLANARTATA